MKSVLGCAGWRYLNIDFNATALAGGFKYLNMADHISVAEYQMTFYLTGRKSQPFIVIIQNFLVFVFPCACSTQEKSEKSSQWNLAQVSLHTRNNAITTKRTRLVSGVAVVV